MFFKKKEQTEYEFVDLLKYEFVDLLIRLAEREISLSTTWESNAAKTIVLTEEIATGAVTAQEKIVTLDALKDATNYYVKGNNLHVSFPVYINPDMTRVLYRHCYTVDYILNTYAAARKEVQGLIARYDEITRVVDNHEKHKGVWRE